MTVRKCVFRNVGITGLETSGRQLLIEDTSFLGAKNTNIRIGTSMGGGVGQNLTHRVVSQGAQIAIDTYNSRVTISDSVFADNSEVGLRHRSVHYLYPIPIFMTRTTVTGNHLRGLDLLDLSSGGDNFIRGNATDVVGTITDIGKQ
jgi:hypothetical protein